MGIGHRVKTLQVLLLVCILQHQNPDKRVTILKEYALANFPSTNVLKYAMEVEKVTTGMQKTLNQ